jgi:hypothetical protein
LVRRRQILWLSNPQPVFSPSATLFYASLGSKFHKAQALSERHIDALATQLWVWLRTVLMGRVWGSAVASAATCQRIRRAERHKRCNEVLAQSPWGQFPRELKHARTSLGCEEIVGTKLNVSRWNWKIIAVNFSRSLSRKLKTSPAMTLIEIRPHRWGWKAFEAPGVEPVFPKRDQAIDYAQNRACFRSGEIHVLDSAGKLERTIAFSEADRKL